MVTRNDVAKLANVSPSVVSYVINNSNYVSQEKRDAVLAAIKELNYIPNQNAKNLRQGRTHMIAVVRGNQLNDMFNNLLYYMEHFAADKGYQLALLTVTKDMGRYATDEFINSLISRHYDAVFIANSSLTEQQINLLALSNTKVLLYVTRDYYGLDENVGQIVPDYRPAIHDAVNRIIALGHRNIAILPNICYPLSQRTVSNHRFAGYMDAMTENGVNINFQYVPDSFQSIRDVCSFVTGMYERSRVPHPPTAICGDEPFVMVNVLKQLNYIGLSVPDDVSLLCFSNSTMSIATSPEFSTIGFKPGQFAQTALDMIIDLIHGKPASKIYIKLDYFERESIAAPPAREPEPSTLREYIPPEMDIALI